MQTLFDFTVDGFADIPVRADSELSDIKRTVPPGNNIGGPGIVHPETYGGELGSFPWCNGKVGIYHNGVSLSTAVKEGEEEEQDVG